MAKKQPQRAAGPKRGEDQDTLTISLPKELKAAIKAAAEADERSTSNYIVKELSKLLLKTEK